MSVNYFKSNNTNDMMGAVYPLVGTNTVTESSRNGEVYRFKGLSVMEYEKPNQTVNFYDERDMNPYFTVMEIAWMLAGRKDVKFLHYFNKNMKNYSDDGFEFNAAYGYRLRHHFGFDQLEAVIQKLREDRNTRQAVCQIWDPQDLIKETADKACNMQLVFSLQQESSKKLDMIIYNRSNDAVWGAVSGTNPAHFGAIHQYVCSGVGLEQGNMLQVSANLHLYSDNPKTHKLINTKKEELKSSDLYSKEVGVRLTTRYDHLYMLRDLDVFFSWFDENPLLIINHVERVIKGEFNIFNENAFDNDFVHNLTFLFASYDAYKQKDFTRAKKLLENLGNNDWGLRCRQWLQKREKNYNEKKAQELSERENKQVKDELNYGWKAIRDTSIEVAPLYVTQYKLEELESRIKELETKNGIK